MYLHTEHVLLKVRGDVWSGYMGCMYGVGRWVSVSGGCMRWVYGVVGVGYMEWVDGCMYGVALWGGCMGVCMVWGGVRCGCMRWVYGVGGGWVYGVGGWGACMG